MCSMICRLQYVSTICRQQYVQYDMQAAVCAVSVV